MTIDEAVAYRLDYPRSFCVDRQSGRLWQMQQLVVTDILGLWDILEQNDLDVAFFADLDVVCETQWQQSKPACTANTDIEFREWIADVSKSGCLYDGHRYMRFSLDRDRVWCDGVTGDSGERADWQPCGFAERHQLDETRRHANGERPVDE